MIYLISLPQYLRHLFQFIAIPTVSLAVITTLSMLGAKKDTGRIFGHAVTYTLLTTICAAAVGLWFIPLDCAR